LLLVAGCGLIDDNQRSPPGRGEWPIECDLSSVGSVNADPECLQKLRESCLALAEETSCTEQPAFEFGKSGSSYTSAYLCVWSPVVTINNNAGCAVESIDYRCDLARDIGRMLLTCSHPCESANPWSYWNALPSENELISICGGPVGPWAASGQLYKQVYGCADAVALQDPLCDCAEVACEVTFGAAGASGTGGAFGQ
jgi:hypothetical protein